MKTRKKIIFVFLAVLFAIILAVIAFFLYQKKNTKGPESLVFNPNSEEWENVQNIPRIEIEEIEPNSNEDGLNNRSVVRGFFDHIDSEKNEVTIKMSLPFTGDRQFKLSTFKLAPDQKFYCSPSTITDQKTGKTHETKNLGFIVKSGQVMNISREQLIPFDQIYEKADKNTYVFLHLTKDYSEKEKNYIQKMVVVGLCD